MRVLVAIFLLASFALLWALLAIVQHVRRTRRRNRRLREEALDPGASVMLGLSRINAPIVPELSFQDPGPLSSSRFRTAAPGTTPTDIPFASLPPIPARFSPTGLSGIVPAATEASMATGSPLTATTPEEAAVPATAGIAAQEEAAQELLGVAQKIEPAAAELAPQPVRIEAAPELVATVEEPAAVVLEESSAPENTPVVATASVAQEILEAPAPPPDDESEWETSMLRSLSGGDRALLARVRMSEAWEETAMPDFVLPSRVPPAAQLGMPFGVQPALQIPAAVSNDAPHEAHPAPQLALDPASNTAYAANSAPQFAWSLARPVLVEPETASAAALFRQQEAEVLQTSSLPLPEQPEPAAEATRHLPTPAAAMPATQLTPAPGLIPVLARALPVVQAAQPQTVAPQDITPEPSAITKEPSAQPESSSPQANSVPAWTPAVVPVLARVLPTSLVAAVPVEALPAAATEVSPAAEAPLAPATLCAEPELNPADVPFIPLAGTTIPSDSGMPEHVGIALPSAAPNDALPTYFDAPYEAAAHPAQAPAPEAPSEQPAVLAPAASAARYDGPAITPTFPIAHEFEVPRAPVPFRAFRPAPPLVRPQRPQTMTSAIAAMRDAGGNTGRDAYGDEDSSALVAVAPRVSSQSQLFRGAPAFQRSHPPVPSTSLPRTRPNPPALSGRHVVPPLRRPDLSNYYSKDLGDLSDPVAPRGRNRDDRKRQA